MGIRKKNVRRFYSSQYGVFPSFFLLLFPTRMPLNFYLPFLYGFDRLHTALPLPRCRPQRPPGIEIGTLNIRDGRGFGLAQTIRVVEQRGFNVMVLTETKIQTEAYWHSCLGYNVTCLKACPSRTGLAQCGVGLVTREQSVGWWIESTRFHGPNVEARWVNPPPNRLFPRHQA